MIDRNGRPLNEPAAFLSPPCVDIDIRTRSKLCGPFVNFLLQPRRFEKRWKIGGDDEDHEVQLCAFHGSNLGPIAAKIIEKSLEHLRDRGKG